MSVESLNIADARKIAQRLQCDGVIIIAIEYIQGGAIDGKVEIIAEGEIKSVSYGATKAKCGFLGRALDRIHKGVIKPEFWKSLTV